MSCHLDALFNIPRKKQVETHTEGPTDAHGFQYRGWRSSPKTAIRAFIARVAAASSVRISERPTTANQYFQILYEIEGYNKLMKLMITNILIIVVWWLPTPLF